MIQRDYIMRMIQQANRMLGKLLEMKNVDDDNPILEIIQQAYTEALPFDKDELLAISVDKFKSWLISQDLHEAQLSLLAHVLRQEAELFYKQGNSILANQNFQKALITFGYIDEIVDTFSMDRQADILDIRNRIQELNLTEPSKSTEIEHPQ